MKAENHRADVVQIDGDRFINPCVSSTELHFGEIKPLCGSLFVFLLFLFHLGRLNRFILFAEPPESLVETQFFGYCSKRNPEEH